MDKPGDARTFDTRTTCDAFLAEALGSGTDPIDEACRSAFLDLCREPAPSPGGFEVTFGRWVIKFEDIGVFAAVRNAFISLGSVNYVFRDLGAAGVAAVIFATVEVLVNVRRSLGHVTARQARILAIMKRAGEPVSIKEIACQPTEDGDLEWNAKTIESELKGMQQVLIRKGSLRVVDCLPDGRWFLNGI